MEKVQALKMGNYSGRKAEDLFINLLVVVAPAQKLCTALTVCEWRGVVLRQQAFILVDCYSSFA